MNLAEALNEALPSVPMRGNRSSMPRLDPNLVARENIEDGEPVIAAVIRNTDKMFRFTIAQWRLIELFDGVRSYEDIANEHAERYAVAYSDADIQEFAASMDDAGLWYKTPLEKLGSNYHQHKHGKPKSFDVAHIQFSAWDPDRYFTRIYPHLRWLYSRWFTVATLIAFAFMACIFIANWGQIGQDTLQFYNFADKSAADLGEFWILFLILGFFHESAHGLTCKHYGAEVHSMGFHLIYLTPAFFVDVSEAWVYASRWQRFATIIAGVWVEIIMCSIASFVWWGTPAGSDAHDIAYKIILLTGIAVVVINMNPLIKLDGYYAFSEIIGFSDIKEKATAYLSGMTRQKIFRLPVEVEFVPKRRRAGFLLYALLSGVYSYSLLLTFLRFFYHVAYRFAPIWAFLPTVLLGFVIFRSRLRTLRNFVRTVYLDKRERMLAWFHWHRSIAGLVLLAALIFIPIWPQTIAARFAFEPWTTQPVNAKVPGRVTDVLVHEGETVTAGQPLIQMTSLQADSQLQGAAMRLVSTGQQRAQAELAHTDLNTIHQQFVQAGTERKIAEEQHGDLVLRASIDGTVITPRMADLAGSYLDAGAPIAQVADISRMRARIYVLEYVIGRVRPAQAVELLPDGAFSSRKAVVQSISRTSTTEPVSLETVKKINGPALQYFVVDAAVPNDGTLLAGMDGTAKIHLGRQSLAHLIAREARIFFDRKVW